MKGLTTLQKKTMRNKLLTKKWQTGVYQPINLVW
jgi:hypothetical protein